MFKKILFLCFPIVLISSQFETTLQDEVEWLNEETTVISASRVKQNINKTPASISVIDEDMIKSKGVKNFLDLLDTVTGINISQTYVYLEKIGVRGIQGSFSGKVLILLDGHSLNNDLLNGGAIGAYKNFPIETIKRIEVVKGPASALYGENAFTALINIITKKSEDINGFISTLKIASHDTKRVNLLYGEDFKEYSITTSIDMLSSDGDSVYVQKDSVGNSGDTNPTVKDMSFYFSYLNKINGVYLKGNYNNIENGPNYGAAHALNDEDLSKRESYFIETGIKKDLKENLALHSRVYYDFYGIENRWEVYPEGYPTSAFTDGMLGYSLYDSLKYGIENLLTLENESFTLVSGLSYETQELKNPSQKMNWNPTNGSPLSSVQDFSDPSTNFISEQDRKFWSVYSELLYDLRDDIRVNLGARYDNYDDFGGVTNPRVGTTWAINENNNLKFMYGEAFRAPTFAELYNKNNPTNLGNKDLDPETVKTYEITLENSTINDLRNSITFFNSDIKDIITLKNSQYANEGKAQTKGVEMEIRYNLNRGSYVLSNYTYQKAKNKDTNQELENIPTHMGYLGMNYRINRYFNLYTDMKYLASQTRSSSDTRSEVDNSIVANTTLHMKDLLSKNIEIKVSVFNLFDEKSYDSGSTIDYPIAYRYYLAELSYKF